MMERLVIFFSFFVIIRSMYTWTNNQHWDSIVGITINNEPTCTGVFIGPNVVLTSANPIERQIEKHKTNHTAIQIYVIDGDVTKAKKYSANCIRTPYADDTNGVIRFESEWWLGFGVEGNRSRNSPMHDLLTITLEEERSSPINVAVKADNVTGRFPTIVDKIATYNDNMVADDWSFAGFGYMNRRHMKTKQTQLKTVYYATYVFENCDEWIPRAWGLFLCIKNKNVIAGVPSGGPLFHQGTLFGIASFSVFKDDESIHVFTDIRPYVEELGGLKFCSTSWKSVESIKHK